MNLSLEQLRQQQKANPPAPEGPKVNPEWERAPGRILGLEPNAFQPLNVGPSPKLPEEVIAALGYCRIFPATFPSFASIPEDWKKEFWSGPSPWCRIDGMPDHPDFEKNLVALENS